MRWTLTLASLALLACGQAFSPQDGGTDASAADATEIDAATIADAGAPDAGFVDASGACTADIAIRSVTAITGSGDEQLAAISPDPIDGSFAIAGFYDGDVFGFDALVVSGAQGYHATVSDDASGTLLRRVRTYASGLTTGLLDAFVDTHGSTTLGGVINGDALVDRTSVHATSEAGLVVRLVAGVPPLVTTITASGPVMVTATSRRGDGYFVAGRFQGELTLGATHCVANGVDGFVAAYTFEGTLDWARCIGGAGNQEVIGLAMHDAGDAYVVGSFADTISIGGGVPSLTARGYTDGFVARFAGAGDPLWVTSVGTSDGATSEGLGEVVVSGSRVVAAGTLGPASAADGDVPLGGTDGVLVALDPLHGAVVDLARVGGPGDDELGPIAADRCGRAWIAGRLGAQGIVRRLDVSTLALDADVLDASSGTGLAPTAIAVTQAGDHVLVGGTYSSSTTIAGTTLPAPASGTDLFLIGLR